MTPEQFNEKYKGYTFSVKAPFNRVKSFAIEKGDHSKERFGLCLGLFIAGFASHASFSAPKSILEQFGADFDAAAEYLRVWDKNANKKVVSTTPKAVPSKEVKKELLKMEDLDAAQGDTPEAKLFFYSLSEKKRKSHYANELALLNTIIEYALEFSVTKVLWSDEDLVVRVDLEKPNGSTAGFSIPLDNYFSPGFKTLLFECLCSALIRFKSLQ